MSHYIKYAKLVCLCALVSVMLWGCNTPRPYEVVNEVGEPLRVDEAWIEEGLFEVRITDVQWLSMEEVSQLDFASLYDSKYQSLEEKGEPVMGLALEYQFKNLGIEGFSDDAMKYYEGMYMEMFGYGSEDVFMLDMEATESVGFRYRIPPGSESEDCRVLLYVTEGNDAVQIHFNTVKDDLNTRYEKRYEIQMPS